MEKLKVFDCFSGIGGFKIAAELADPEAFETIAFCENEPHARKVLRHRYPNTLIFEDIRDVTAQSFRTGLPDIIVGGFPCQGASQAGKRMGLADDRTGLFWEIIRLVNEVRPKYLYLENVANLLCVNERRDFGTILGSLAEAGYDAEWDCISAAEVGGVHKRDRIWIIAYPKNSDAQLIS